MPIFVCILSDHDGLPVGVEAYDVATQRDAEVKARSLALASHEAAGFELWLGGKQVGVHVTAFPEALQATRR